MKLTFKQYIESKERLKEAALKAPKYTIDYSVRKYCKLVVGESKEDKIYVSLKPNQKISIEWLLEDIDNPQPIKIQFNDVREVDSATEYQTFWSSPKLSSWLYRNTKEETPKL